MDGHHRIAAYRLRGHKKPIKCEWFAGTPREAVDECMRRNSRDHLPISLADRSEEAWRRVLLDQGSKKKISGACGISSGTVANMRRAKRLYETDPGFAARVGRPLLETSWGLILLAHGNVREQEFDLDERADMLARTIGSRLSNLLVKDPVVTAYALARYDKYYHEMLEIRMSWSGRMAIPAPRNLTEPEMKRQMEVLRQRADSIEAMLAKIERERPGKLAEVKKKRDVTKRGDPWRLGPPRSFDPTEDDANAIEFLRVVKKDMHFAHPPPQQNDPLMAARLRRSAR